MGYISTEVALVVLFSALIHASWNAVLKSGSQKLIDATLMTFFGGLFCFIALLFLPIVNAAAWPYVISSAIIHVVYFICLSNAYKHSDFSHAYPIIRGLAPPAIALLALLIAGEALSWIVWAGIFLISLGILIPGRLNKDEMTFKSIIYIVLTALCIVSYSVVDGLGVRVSGNAASYVIYMSFIESIIFITVILFYIGKKEIFAYAPKRWKVCAIAGIVSILGYGLVLWAMNQAPIGVVAALRETSIVFGTLIGIYLFKDGFGKKRLMTALFICLGVFLIKMS